jgi:septal ring factor EnvC (AmiA/AmiB activator)
MFDNQLFKRATDWVKYHKKVSLGDQSKALNLPRHAMDNMRRGSASVQPWVIEKLLTVYPFDEIKAIFAENKQKKTKTKDNIEPYKELTKVQKKLIEKLDQEIDELKKNYNVLEKEYKKLKGHINGKP